MNIKINILTFNNGRRQTKSYDQNYGIDAISSTSAGGLTLDFSLDAVGNVQDASSALGLTPPTQRYRYDDLYRLTEVDSATAAILEGYTYAKTGDRTRKTKQGQADQIYVYPTTSHRLQSVAGTPRTYDADGNLTSMGLSYDARNRLAGWQLQPDGTINLVSNSVQYQYNGKGERVAKQSVTYDNATPLPGEPSGWLLGGQAYVYGEGGQITGEYSITGQAIVEYLYIDNQPIAIQKANKLYYIETDHLNTPRQVIDPTRNVTVWRWDFFGSAFGENLPNQDPDADGIPFVLNLRFTGQYYDQETNLNYNHFRDYEPNTGRYVESDPIGLDGGPSTYAFVSSSSLNRTDFYGLAGCGSGWNERLVPDNPFRFKFSSCCDDHDDCYDCKGLAAGFKKNDCDTNFRNCMRGKCNKYSPPIHFVCNRFAGTYYQFVKRLGQSSYDGGVKNCPCNPSGGGGSSSPPPWILDGWGG